MTTKLLPAVPLQLTRLKRAKRLLKRYAQQSISYCLSKCLIGHQVPEKRPEVRLLEYHEVPGILMDSKYNFVQKVIAASAKRPKLATPRDPHGKSCL